MKKVYQLENLDCANCAAKMQNAIGKIEGVKSVSVNFLTQKLTLEADDIYIDDLTEKAVAACKRIEPDCIIKVK